MNCSRSRQRKKANVCPSITRIHQNSYDGDVSLAMNGKRERIQSEQADGAPLALTTKD
jgi:hypothetical protein